MAAPAADIPPAQKEPNGSEEASHDSGDHVKRPSRPPNSWILWRKTMIPGFEDRLEAEKTVPNWANISTVASEEWHAMPEAEKKTWDDKAAAISAEHKAKDPGYVYQPKKAANRAGKKPTARARANMASKNNDKPNFATEQRPLPQGTIDPALLLPQPDFDGEEGGE
ncbi:hypothetical protein GGR56DRAFT_693517 [Xylariaceae sp. FL0804]|nr:hypothetical protein GGR56DRAFT_693517 [Xylariaceae sp. FL0804]